MNDNEPTTKKSLINSFGILQAKVAQLAELSELSNEMIRVFRRTNNGPTPEREEKKSPVSNNPNLIDMFNILADDMQEYMNAINNNIQMMTDWSE